MSWLPLELFPERENKALLLRYYPEDDYEGSATCDYWKRNIIAYCLFKKQLTFSLHKVIEDFTVYSIVPTAANKSVRDLAGAKQVFDREYLANYTPPSNTKGGIVASIFTAISSIVAATPIVNVNNIENNELILDYLLQKIENLVLKMTKTGSTNDCYYLFETSSIDKSLCFTTFITATAASMMDELLATNRGTMSTDEVVHKYLLHYMMSVSPNDLSLIVKYMTRNKNAVVSADNSMIKLGSNSVEITDSDSSILTVKNTLSEINKKVENANQIIATCVLRATQYATNNSDKTAALYQLKLKKNKVVERDRLVSYQLQLVTLLDSIDNAKMNVNMVSTLKSAKDVLHQLNTNVDVDDIEEVMDSLTQLTEETNEVSRAIGDNYGIGSGETDDELMEELDKMIGNVNLNDSETAQMGSSRTIIEKRLPAVPQTRTSDEKEEMRTMLPS